MTKQLRLRQTALRFVCPSLDVRKAEALSIALAKAMSEYHINNPKRAAMFIAQIAHESGQFRYREEIASGAAYEGRHDLGNTHAGDGIRFKGRGWLQITGRANYLQVGKALYPKTPNVFTNYPYRLANDNNACRSAAWWWSAHDLNHLADLGTVEQVTRVINGGYNGLADRKAYLRRARIVARFLVPKVR